MPRFICGRNLLKRSPGEESRGNIILFYKEMESPVGKLKLVASADALVAILWERERPNRIRLAMLSYDPQQPILIDTERQLKEYFAGTRSEFNLRLVPP